MSPELQRHCALAANGHTAACLLFVLGSSHGQIPFIFSCGSHLNRAAVELVPSLGKHNKPAHHMIWLWEYKIHRKIQDTGSRTTLDVNVRLQCVLDILDNCQHGCPVYLPSMCLHCIS